jgi:hypothetical protein
MLFFSLCLLLVQFSLVIYRCQVFQIFISFMENLQKTLDLGIV